MTKKVAKVEQHIENLAMLIVGDVTDRSVKEKLKMKSIDEKKNSVGEAR